MIKRIVNPKGLYKLIFITTIPFIILVCGFSQLNAARQKGTEPEEIKNNIFNLYDREMGRVNKKGAVFNISQRKLGSVDKDGVIYNVSDLEIGKVEPDGSVLNQSGTKLGSVNKKGDVFNVSERKVGSVKGIEDIKLIGGAARLIFFK